MLLVWEILGKSEAWAKTDHLHGKATGNSLCRPESWVEQSLRKSAGLGKQYEPGWWSFEYGSHLLALCGEGSEKEQWRLPALIFFNCFLKVYCIDYAITVVPFFLPFIFLCYAHLPAPQHPGAFSSCPWVVHISFLAFPFPILFLTSPCLFCTYHLCFLFPILFPPFSLLPLPTDSPPCDLHFCDSVPVLVVCFVFVFVLFFRLSS